MEIVEHELIQRGVYLSCSMDAGQLNIVLLYLNTVLL